MHTTKKFSDTKLFRNRTHKPQMPKQSHKLITKTMQNYSHLIRNFNTILHRDNKVEKAQKIFKLESKNHYTFRCPPTFRHSTAPIIGIIHSKNPET